MPWSEITTASRQSARGDHSFRAKGPSTAGADGVLPRVCIVRLNDSTRVLLSMFRWSRGEAASLECDQSKF
jgi:hypothetical protein